MRYVVPDHVAENVIAVGQEGRGVQRWWRAQSPEGRELVCAIAAFGPDIESLDDFPSEYMPQWLIFLIPTLSENISSDELSAFLVSLGERARLWRHLDEAAWDRVRVRFLIACIVLALGEAKSVRPLQPPEWYRRATDAAEHALTLLRAPAGTRLAEVEAMARRAAEDARMAAAAAREVSDTDLAGRAMVAMDAAWTAQAAVSPANAEEGWEASRAAQMCARGWSSAQASKAGWWAPPSVTSFAWEAELLGRLASTLFASLEAEIIAARAKGAPSTPS